ncbi:MAG: hypothetical protein M3Q58_03235 [Bacteroidota bacterium]|nr:hypothetical protein [Bacteroidota bacterium]
MKQILLLVFIAFGTLLQLQGQGLATGLARDFQSSKRIEDSRRHSSNMELAYKERYNNIRAAYKKKLELNFHSANPQAEPLNGWFTALATNGFDFVENRQVFVENGIVTKYKNGHGESFTILEGGKIQQFRTVIKNSANLTFELLFNLKIEN